MFKSLLKYSKKILPFSFIYMDMFRSIELLTLYHALELNLFELIEQNKLDLTANAKNWDIKTLMSLINVLISYNYLKRKGNKIYVTQKAKKFLKNKEIPLLLLNRMRESIIGIDNSIDFMKSGEKKKKKFGMIGYTYMTNLVVDLLFNKVGLLKKNNLIALDIGCGHCTFPYNLLKKNPGLKFVAIEKDSALFKIAKDNIANWKKTNQIRLIKGNFLSKKFDQKFDIIFMSGILHYFKHNELFDLFKKAKNLLSDKGIIILRAQLLNDDGSKPRLNAIFDLQLRGYSEFTNQKNRTELMKIIRKSGFENIKRIKILPFTSLDCYILN